MHLNAPEYKALHAIFEIFQEALKDFWDYCEERQREERIIADMKIKDENKD